MFSQEFITKVVDFLVIFATDILLPLMFFVFTLGVLLRILIHYTISREKWFTKEFEKRIYSHIKKSHHAEQQSFFITAKKILEKNYYEIFIFRSIMKRRKPDFVMDLSDRFFLVQEGSARLVKDTLKLVKYLKYGSYRPRFLSISKSVFQNNPCFNNLFGILPISATNDILNILPGIFIIGGIFGTFLGIMQGLPSLGGMDLQDIEGTKKVMDAFLLKISFSMSTSIIGILLSVSMSFINTLFSPEKTFVYIIEKYDNCLDILWNRSQNNTLPEEISGFNKNRDPLEALAEDAVNKEIQKKRKGVIDYDEVKFDDYIKDHKKGDKERQMQYTKKSSEMSEDNTIPDINDKD